MVHIRDGNLLFRDDNALSNDDTDYPYPVFEKEDDCLCVEPGYELQEIWYVPVSKFNKIAFLPE